MHLFERMALFASAVIGLSIAGWMAFRGRDTPRVMTFVPVPIPYVPESPPPPDPAWTETPGLLHHVRDPDPACGPDAVALTDAVRGWLAEPRTDAIWVDPQRGIAFSHSAVDTGRDAPLPKRFGAESKLACGSEAGW